VSARLHVTGAPNIVVAPGSLAFGSQFVGATRVDTVTVRNNGTDLLHVTDVQITPAQFQISTAPFDLAVGAFRTLLVTFAPTAPGVFDGTLSIASNDPDDPTAVMHLHGEGLVAPDIAVAPSSLALSLLTGETDSRTLTLRNVGGSPLTWTALASSATLSSQSPVFGLGAAGPNLSSALDKSVRSRIPVAPPVGQRY